MQGFQAKILFNQIFLDFFIKKKFKNRNKTFIKIRKKNQNEELVKDLTDFSI
jgi:hypothetical protein